VQVKTYLQSTTLLLVTGIRYVLHSGFLDPSMGCWFLVFWNPAGSAGYWCPVWDAGSWFSGTQQGVLVTGARYGMLVPGFLDPSNECWLLVCWSPVWDAGCWISAWDVVFWVLE